MGYVSITIFLIWKRRATSPASNLFVVKLLINEGISFPFAVLPYIILCFPSFSHSRSEGVEGL